MRIVPCVAPWSGSATATSGASTAARGQRGLLGTFSQIPQVQLVALCESDPALLEREGAPARRALRRSRSPAGLRRVRLRPGGPPRRWSARGGHALLRQGKHCFLEKSIARTAEEFRPVLDARAASGAHCLVDFPWRFHPALATMRELLDSASWAGP